MGPSTDAESAKHKRPVAARRFHLSPSNLALAPSKHSGGIRKHKTHTRSHLATFVERHGDRVNNGQLDASNNSFAIDRLIDDAKFSPNPASVPNSASACMGYSPKLIRPFVKAPTAFAKTGHSIKDHPSTWDYDSDQLADELAAFSWEISGEDTAGKKDELQVELPGRRTPAIADTDTDMDDLYVYETYLRVPRSELSPSHEGTINSIGMLVIEERDEELWQTFAEDEEDSEWDEDDADSNGMSISQLTFDLLTYAAEDNPRNDYPEDEVSSEDEYGHRAYKYRHGASDDEEYDLEEAPSDDENEIA
jgi:Transcription factor Iwr1